MAGTDQTRAIVKGATGVIELTPLGRRVALGAVTQNEFAWVMVEETVLPNPLTYSPREIRKWHDARLEIRPFRLLIQILSHLAQRGGLDKAFITVPELISIVIPLAGVTAPAEVTAEALVQYRDGHLSLAGWPDCAPRSNDQRLAREFLLFLANYNICMKTTGDASDEDRYYLDSAFDVELANKIGETATIMDQSEAGTAQVLETLRQSLLPSASGREKADLITACPSRAIEIPARSLGGIRERVLGDGGKAGRCPRGCSYRPG